MTFVEFCVGFIIADASYSEKKREELIRAFREEHEFLLLVRVMNEIEILELRYALNVGELPCFSEREEKAVALQIVRELKKKLAPDLAKA